MLTIEYIGKERLIAKFKAMPDKVRLSVAMAVRVLSTDLMRHVVNDKLQGQVLNHITGRLMGSISIKITESPTEITGKVFSSKACNYAAYHEYGFNGTQNVKEHIRTVIFGRTVPAFTVPAHSRTVNYPARSFLRSSLEDYRQKIIDGLTEAAKKGVAK